MKLDKNGPLTLTYQVTEILRNRILTECSPGDRLPPEKDLVVEFDVSVMTVKNAMDNLVKEGLVYRRRGKGTFVAEKKISSETSKLKSATDLFNQYGMKSNVEILDFKVEPVGVFHANLLGCPDTELVYKLVRLRMLDDEPFSYETNYLKKSIFPDLERNYTDGSLYACMENKYGVIPSRSEEVYKAVLLGPVMAKALEQDKDDAALAMKSKVFDQYGRLISIEESVYRSDKFELKVVASANQSESERLIVNDGEISS